MNVFDKSKHITKRAVISGTALAMVLTPTAALAHGSHDNDSNGRGSSRQAATTQQQKQKSDNNSRSSWWQRNHDRQKQTCDERQADLNKRAADAQAKYGKKLTGLGIIYSGVQTYAHTDGVVVENYDAMDAQVAADKTTAENAVAAIAAPQLNCADQNSAAAVSDDNKTWHDRDNHENDSINAARNAINTYRKNLNTLYEAAINS